MCTRSVSRPIPCTSSANGPRTGFSPSISSVTMPLVRSGCPGPAMTSLRQGRLSKVGGAEAARAVQIEAHVAVERARARGAGEALGTAGDGVRPGAVVRTRPLPAGVFDDVQNELGAVGRGQGVGVRCAESARVPADRGGRRTGDRDRALHAADTKAPP